MRPAAPLYELSDRLTRACRPAFEGRANPGLGESRGAAVRDLDVTVVQVLTGALAKDTGASSHRWLEEEHFDPDGSEVCKLKKISPQFGAKSVWLDWMCVPQWHGGGRTEDEKQYFRVHWM